MQLVQSYQTLGHVQADVDPLNLREFSSSHRDLQREFKNPNNFKNKLIYSKYGFTVADLEREFYIDAPEMGVSTNSKNDVIYRDCSVLRSNGS